MDYDEINKSKKDLWEFELRLNSKRRFETILKLYTVLGVLTALFAVAYFILSFLEIDLTNNQTTALLVAGVSIVLSMTSWALLLFRKQREFEESKKIRSMQSLSEIIFLWAEFEEAGKAALKERKVKYNTHSARQMMHGLEKYELIDSRDQILMEEAMQIRNAVAHGQLELSQEMIHRTVTSIANVIEKISTNNAN